MRYLMIKDEQTLDDVIKRLYKGLTEKQTVTVQTALLKANPPLRDVEKLTPGTLVRVPRLSADIEKKARDTGKAAPMQDLQVVVVEGLAELQDKIKTSVKQRADNDKQDSALLKKAAFSKAAKTDPVAKENAELLTKRIAATKKLDATRLKAVDAAVKHLTKVASLLSNR